jgi:hypothetical protein
MALLRHKSSRVFFVALDNFDAIAGFIDLNSRAAGGSVKTGKRERLVMPVTKPDFTAAIRIAAISAAAVGALIMILSVSPSNAAPQPPNDRCRPASKLEYNSARKQYLLRSRFGMYVRTGWALRRLYWYCQY